MNSLVEGDLQDDDELDEPLAVSVTRRDRKRKSKEEEYEREETDVVIESSKRERDRRRSKALEDPDSPKAGKKPKLRDVTNAPPPRPSLLTIPGGILLSVPFLTARMFV